MQQFLCVILGYKPGMSYPAREQGPQDSDVIKESMQSYVTVRQLDES